MMDARGWSDSRKEPQTKECRQPPEMEKGREIDFETDPEASRRNTALLMP